MSNSVRHPGLGAEQVVRVGAGVADGMLRLKVDDPGSAGTVAGRDPDVERGGGFGLRLVEMLAPAWGISREAHTGVWVELVCWPVNTRADV